MPAASTYQASDGASYELFLGRWTKVLAPHLLDFAEFSSDGPLLDVGTGPGRLEVEIEGALTGLLSPDAFPNGRKGVAGLMVAGAGFEPATSGL